MSEIIVSQNVVTKIIVILFTKHLFFCNFPILKYLWKYVVSSCAAFYEGGSLKIKLSSDVNHCSNKELKFSPIQSYQSILDITDIFPAFLVQSKLKIRGVRKRPNGPIKGSSPVSALKTHSNTNTANTANTESIKYITTSHSSSVIFSHNTDPLTRIRAST